MKDRAKRIVAFAGTVMVVLMTIQMLTTGYPIPLWHIERLHAPVRVAGFGSNSITLVDGRVLSAPALDVLPVDVASNLLSHGVEIGTNGVLYVLTVLRPWCGNDPYVYLSFRVSLEEQATLWTNAPGGIRLKRNGRSSDNVGQAERKTR